MIRRLPVLWQTLLLVLATLVAAQTINVALVMAMPSPRPDFFTIEDLALALGAPRREEGHRHRHRPPLPTVLVPDPPPLGPDMARRADVTAALADRLGVADDAVRLVYRRDQASFPFRSSASDGLVTRRGEPLFLNTVVAALRQPDGRWRTVRTPERPWLSEWQRRAILWFGLSALAVLPLAFLFARQLARPMHRFAEAANRVGHDPDAPPVPLSGPAELDVAARALTAMQGRLHDMLAERTAMAVAIAHDLRTPLARIAFRIEAAPDGVRTAVQRDIEQMRAMIADTIGFVSGTFAGGTREPVDLAPLLARIVEAARDMGADTRLSGAAPPVLGDPVALERLFQNILDNAVTYAGGAEVTLARDGDGVAVRFADRGPGLPPEKLESVFRPFDRVDPSRSRSTGGVGLGLAIARSIARAHGGGVTATNREGGGLTVAVLLPAGTGRSAPLSS